MPDETGRAKTAVDRHVGAKIRMRRMMLGWSQERLADAVGVTFQQIQKYENGKNRVSCGRLFEIAKALDAAPFWFFEGAPGVVHPDPGVNRLATTFFGTVGAATMAAYYLRLSPKERVAVLDMAAMLVGKAADAA